MNEFWRGYLVSAFVVCAIQDYYGKEGYIKHLQENWADTSMWMWIGLIVLFLVGPFFYSPFKARFKCWRRGYHRWTLARNKTISSCQDCPKIKFEKVMYE